MVIERKYYSINEVSKMTGLSISKLRYAERIIPGFNIHKIRSRRYYTKKNLEHLNKAYGFDISTPQFLNKCDQLTQIAALTTTPKSISGTDIDHSSILGRIDKLVIKLSALFSNVVNSK